MGLLWLLIPAAPLIGMALLWWQSDRCIPWLWLTCVPGLAAAVWPPAGVFFTSLWPGATWGADDLVTRALLGMSAVLWAAASLYAWASERTHERRHRFWTFWLLSLSGNLLLIIAQDALSFYTGFSVMSLSAYGLVVHLGGPGPRQAGRLYVQLAIISEMMLYGGMALRAHEASSDLHLALWQATPIGTTTAILIITGFGIKAGFWPLHVWLPQAHPAAPAAASAVLSGAMIKAGLLGLWRFLPRAEAVTFNWPALLFGVGLSSVFYGALLGLTQTRAKSALAFSSVSQMGYLLAIVAASWQSLDKPVWALLLALYLVHHGLAKGALFMGAGLAGHYRLTLWQWGLMAVPALAIAGFPLTSGGAVKTLLKTSLQGSVFAPWLPLISLGAAASTLVIARAFWLMVKSQPAGSPDKPGWPLTFPWGLCCAAPLLLPWLWPSFYASLMSSLTLSASRSLLLPIAGAAVLILAAIWSGGRLPHRRAKLPNPGRYASLRLKRSLYFPPERRHRPSFRYARQWRQLERRWNRFCQQGTVAISAWVLCGLLAALAWLW